MGVYRCCLITPQRLLESTFRLDIAAAREYCEADDRWVRATAFLAANGAAGWSLIEVRFLASRGFRSDITTPTLPLSLPNR